MQIEDVLRAQRNQAIDALAQLEVVAAALRQRVAEMEAKVASVTPPSRPEARFEIG